MHHVRILLDASPRKPASSIVTDYTKWHDMQAVGLRYPLHRGRTRGSSRTRVARFWLLLVACLAQLWMPPHDEHMRGVAAHVLSSHSDAASSGLATSSISAAKADIRCSPAGAQSGSHDGDAPAPCQQDNCPCCPLVHATVGILPQEAAFAGFAPLLAKTVTPPARLGAFNSSPAFAGQPRAPPVLI